MVTHRKFTGSSSSTIKSHNMRAILLTLRRYEPVSRVRIAQITGLSTTTVTNLITELLAAGIVAEGNTETAEQRGVGRPRTALCLVPEARYALGVHFGVGRVHVAICDLFARPALIKTVAHALNEPPDAVVDAACTALQQVVADSRVAPERIIGVGVGASGLVDYHTGVNILAPNMDWHNIPLRDWFSERLALPVFVDNNVRAMALGEAMFGAARDVAVMAFVYARVGVGAGFVVDGQLYRGGAGAGEIGHVALLTSTAEAPTMHITTLEQLVAEPAILAQAEALAAREPASPLAEHWRAADAPSFDTVLAAAHAGDTATRALLSERATYMGLGLANLVNTLSPEMIVLGGIYAADEDLLLGTIRATLHAHAFAGLGESVTLSTPTFGQDAGVIGAAALALDAFFYEQSEVPFDADA